jgi:hypothetical protein
MEKKWHTRLTGRHYFALHCPSGRIEKNQIKGSRGYYTQHREVIGADCTSKRMLLVWTDPYTSKQNELTKHVNYVYLLPPPLKINIGSYWLGIENCCCLMLFSSVNGKGPNYGTT